MRVLKTGTLSVNSENWTNNLPYLENVARYKVSYYYSLIGSYILAFHWYQNQWPWMTWWPLFYDIWPKSAPFRANMTQWLKWLQQTCSPKHAVFGNISFTVIFAEVTEKQHDEQRCPPPVVCAHSTLATLHSHLSNSWAELLFSY